MITKTLINTLDQATQQIQTQIADLLTIEKSKRSNAQHLELAAHDSALTLVEQAIAIEVHQQILQRDGLKK